MSRENQVVNAQHEGEPAMEPLPHQNGLGVFGKTALATGTALLSAAYPPGAVAFAGAAAGLQALGERLNSLQNSRTAAVLTAAGTESSLPLEDVVMQLVERDDLAFLTAAALAAARRSRIPEKAVALGHALGSILADDALIDLESIWIRVLSVIEPPHIRVLGLFLERTATLGTGSNLWGTGPVLSVKEVGERLGLNEAVLPLVQDLIACGLLMNPGISGAPLGTPNAFGQRLEATTLGAQMFARLSVAGLA